MTGPTSNTPTTGEAVYERVYQAPRELVFECMTTPEHLTHFWGPTGVSTPIENITVDLRVGGLFETIMVNDATGEQYPSRGWYLEVDPPARIVTSEDGTPDGPTNTITFEDLGDGTTRVTVHQTNMPSMYLSPEARAGMQSSFDKFAAYLATR